MKRKILLSIIVLVMSLITLTGCGATLTARPFALELGSSVPEDVLEYVTVSNGNSEDVLANAVLSTGDIDNMTVGQYNATVIYKKQTINVRVDVVDTVAPVLEAKNDTFVAGDALTVNDLVTVRDFSDVTGVVIGKDGKEKDTIIAEEGMRVTVRVTDASGNSSELAVSPKVTTPDTVAPELNGVEDVTVMVGSEFDILADITAVDDVDGNITASIKTKGEVDTATAGEYVITYSVSDKAGNETSLERKITVAKDKKASTKTTASNATANTTTTDKATTPTADTTVVTNAPATVPAPAPTPAPSTDSGSSGGGTSTTPGIIDYGTGSGSTEMEFTHISDSHVYDDIPME